MHLLLIEDSPEDAAPVLAAADALGWTVTHHTSLADVPAGYECDAVLLDLLLPPWRREVITLQRYRLLRIKAPLVVRTGLVADFLSDAVRELAEAYGADAVMSKAEPVTSDLLSETVSTALAK